METTITTISIRVCYAIGEIGCGTIFVDDDIECPNCKRPTEECEQMDMITLTEEK